MHARAVRRCLKLAHLVVAGVMGFCVYAPESEYLWLDRAAEFAVFPLLVLTGLALSQSGRIARLLYRGSSEDMRAGVHTAMQ